MKGTAARAAEMTAAGDAKGAVELIENEIDAGKPQSASTYLQLRHAMVASGRTLDGLCAYERAIKLAPAVAKDEVVRKNVIDSLDTKETVAAAVALELATRVSPPAHDAIAAAASTNRLGDVRRRAAAIAEREGIADKVDRIESWLLDLHQAGTCDDRRRIIAKLAARS